MSDAEANDGGGHDPQKFFPQVHFGRGAQLIGMSGMMIGDGSCISEDAWLNVAVRDGERRLVIGHSVHVGRRCTLSTAGYLEIGDYCLLAPGVYISDTDHRYEKIGVPVASQDIVRDRRLVIEENCWLGIHCAIVGQLTVGRGSVIATNAVVTRDVPPFTVVAGAPATIIKMYDAHDHRWTRVASADDCARLLQSREQYPVPTREEHARMLARTGPIAFHPAAAGGTNIP